MLCSLASIKQGFTMSIYDRFVLVQELPAPKGCYVQGVNKSGQVYVKPASVWRVWAVLNDHGVVFKVISEPSISRRSSKLPDRVKQGWLDVIAPTTPDIMPVRFGVAPVVLLNEN